VDLLEMCFDLNLPPCHVLRQVLTTLSLGLTHSKKTITDVMKDPSSLLSLIPIELVQETLQQRNAILDGSDPATAAHAFLSRLVTDVTLCVDCDSNYGPSSDAARHSAGDEYEVKLYDALGKAGIAYWTEKNLRDTGHHKTPDARLRVPIAVNGRVICWIDSKATFGDEGQHASYRELQYEKYSNRYGPGMVIYWHGYLADLQNLEENVLLVDDFPVIGDIVTLPQLPLDNCGEVVEEKSGGGKARGRLDFSEDGGGIET
jgi:CDAN1-interacting nuclease 1